MQDVRDGSQAPDDRICGVEHLDGGEANLWPLPRSHPGTERARQELGAETDAEHRDASAHHLGEPIALDRERRVAVGLIDVHRPTHRQHPRDLRRTGKRIAFERIDDPDGERSEGVKDSVRALPGRMSEHQQRRNRGIHEPQANRATVRGMQRLRSIAIFRPELRPATMTGAQARGAAALGALAVGAAAVGGFAIGRLSIGRLAIRRASISELKVEDLEIDRLSDPRALPRSVRRQAWSAVTVAILATAALAGVAIARESPAASASALGPYPSLGSCPVFPNPPPGLPADAPSQPNESAWNQDISRAPVDPHSAAYIAYIDSHGG